MDSEEIIVSEEKDEESYIQQNDLEDEQIDVTPENRSILWQPKDITIREFLNMKVDGELDLQPAYQRNYVMNKEKASKLVESILMDMPLPVIYLAEEEDGRLSVIDGQQRLTSFITFLEGKVYGTQKEFSLSGLKVLPELNRKTFADLSDELKMKIRTTTLHTIVIKKKSDPDIKFEIFERLNTGSIKLNEDEVRNTVYRGAFMDLLSELEEDELFHRLVRKDNYKNRMQYRGMILRFFALSEKTHLNYKPSMKQFCNKYLRDNRNIGKEKIADLKVRFKHCLECVHTVFGEQAFRRYIGGDDNHTEGNWSMNTINMALFDIQLFGFMHYYKNQIVPRADAIRESLLQLMTHNTKFIESILIRTSGKNELQTRFDIWLPTLKEIIDQPKTDRIFAYSIKNQLFQADPCCQICKQQIRTIDDAEVDHILPYSQGGQTTLENAQLTHRFCNRNKGNRG